MLVIVRYVRRLVECIVQSTDRLSKSRGFHLTSLMADSTGMVVHAILALRDIGFRRMNLANIASAKKRMRQNVKRRARNRMVRSKTRTFVKKANELIEAGDQSTAVVAVQAAMSQLDRSAQKGVVHHNNADRRKSRLAKKLQALSQAA
jgi:small subunit ribosomal protein S20